MADLKISQLTTWVPLDTDLIPFVDLSWVPVTKKATRADLKGSDWTSATATAWTTTTGTAWTNASVTNSWTTNAAVFDFTIPRGDVGATGTPWAASTVPWPTWNWIASNVLLSTVWLVKTYRITYTDASIFDYTTTDWAAGSGTGDMIAATYDPQTIGADAFNMNNMTESSTKKILTSTERSNIVSNNAKVSDINHVTSELPNVDNTSDANKPVSSAQQTEINTKLDTTWTAADSTKVWGITITGTPTVGQVATATSGAAASWQDAGWGGGSDAFEVYLSADQWLVSAITVVWFNVENLDSWSNFNTTTYQYTAPTNWTYTFTCDNQFDTINTSNYVDWYFYKNWVSYRRQFTFTTDNGGTYHQSMTIVLLLTAGDTIDVRARNTSGTNWDITGTSRWTYFTWYKLY